MRCIDLSGLNLTQFSFLISDSVFPSLRELVLSDNANLKIGACTKLAVLKVSQCKMQDIPLMNLLLSCGSNLQILE